MVPGRIKDKNLKAEGLKRIRWAQTRMPVLNFLREEFKTTKPLKGIRIGACLHVTTETANLMITLKEAGAEVYLCASNPLSTQDDVASSLVEDFEIPVFAIRGDSNEEYYQNIADVINFEPHITLDDGGDLTTYAHKNNLTEGIIGGTEETTTGVIRFRVMEKEGVLKYPIIAVNDSKTKYLFDNRYGTGQSTIDGILRATNILLSGKIFVVCGYGWCGRGIAIRAKGMGARVVITEVDPIKALEAAMDGFEVMPMDEASKIGDVFVTATGDINVIKMEHIMKMKQGAILANAGHFDVEIDVRSLKSTALEIETIRPNLERIKLPNGKDVFLIGEGRLVNLVSAEGHPSEVMDMSFSNQALACIYLLENKGKLQNRVYTLPYEIDERIAKLKLKTMGISIDILTPEQQKYLQSWEEGT